MQLITLEPQSPLQRSAVGLHLNALNPPRELLALSKEIWRGVEYERVRGARIEHPVVTEHGLPGPSRLVPRGCKESFNTRLNQTPIVRPSLGTCHSFPLSGCTSQASIVPCRRLETPCVLQPHLETKENRTLKRMLLKTGA